MEIDHLPAQSPCCNFSRDNHCKCLEEKRRSSVLHHDSNEYPECDCNYHCSRCDTRVSRLTSRMNDDNNADQEPHFRYSSSHIITIPLPRTRQGNSIAGSRKKQNKSMSTSKSSSSSISPLYKSSGRRVALTSKKLRSKLKQIEKIETNQEMSSSNLNGKMNHFNDKKTFFKMPANVLIFSVGVFLLAIQCETALGLDCFVCSSRNGSNPYCDDPFHNLHPTRVATPLIPDRYKPKLVYHTPCYTSRKNRDGLFPASACLKMSGTFDNGETLTVRHCGLDSGTLTQDTEIVRMSHCGSFQFDGKFLTGCLMACTTDACNGSLSGIKINSTIAILISILGFISSIYGLTINRFPLKTTT